jgi:hypothetical protein
MKHFLNNVAHNLSPFYAPTPIQLDQNIINSFVAVLGVQGIVRVTREAEGLYTWDYMNTGDEEWPETEVLGLKVRP